MDFVVVRASHSFRPIISLFCVFFEMIFHNSKGELAVSGNLILNIYSWRRLIVALCTSLFVCRNAWIALSRVNPISINMLMFSSEGSEKFKIIHKTSNYSSSMVINFKRFSGLFEILPSEPEAWGCWASLFCGNPMMAPALCSCRFCLWVSCMSLSIKLSPPRPNCPRGRKKPPRNWLLRCCKRAWN